MAKFSTTVEVTRPWSDWLFLPQERDVDGGGFHVHNPWGNSNQPQGTADRNRLEIAYRTAAGQDLWGQLVLHGPSGNVGIGTVAPTAKLDVNGDLAVNGNIRLKDWSLVVPDTVFEPDYQLAPLAEVRHYIGANKHLPEIPSAAEVAEDGVDVGALCMALLKKVEELTLYVLGQHDAIAALEARLAPAPAPSAG